MEQFIPEIFSTWLTQYGSFALFVLLALGIFALPIPDETLMVFAGALVAHGKLDLIPTCIAAFAGSWTGITLSYLIGKTAGTFVIRRYGHWLRITEAKMQRVHNWFDRTGRWTLFIGYFIPGIRHLTGYAAGISELEYPRFALFAYSGALVWATTFLSIGYFLGYKWVKITELLEDQWALIISIAAVLLIAIGIYIWVSMRNKKKEWNRP